MVPRWLNSSTYVGVWYVFYLDLTRLSPSFQRVRYLYIDPSSPSADADSLHDPIHSRSCDCISLFATPASAQRGASCHAGQSFDQFLAQLKQDAAAAGVSQRAIAEASPYMVYDQGIVNRDRGQRVFGQIFTEFSGRMASEGRRGARSAAHSDLRAGGFARAEKEYGIPPAVITAFWALESDFGAIQGKLPTLRSLVSLAYDCRRSQMFHDETIAALKIIDRGDLSPAEMIGSWAGELGQTQFLPRHYFDYAVDYDGNGHRDLLHSAPDVIGSTANYIATG